MANGKHRNGSIASDKGLPKMHLFDVLNERANDTLDWNESNIGQNSISNYLGLVLRYAKSQQAANNVALSMMDSIQDGIGNLQRSISSIAPGAFVTSPSSSLGPPQRPGVSPSQSSLMGSTTATLSSLWSFGAASSNQPVSNHPSNGTSKNTFNLAVLRAHLNQAATSATMDYAERGLTLDKAMTENPSLFQKPLTTNDPSQLDTDSNNNLQVMQSYVESVSGPLNAYKKGYRASKSQVDELVRISNPELFRFISSYMDSFLGITSAHAPIEHEQQKANSDSPAFDLGSIPPGFLKEDFDPESQDALNLMLGDHDWSHLYGALELTDNGKDSQEPPNSEEIQNTLAGVKALASRYEDLLAHSERELIAELSRNSDAFFEVSEEIDKLKTCLDDTHTDVRALSSELGKILTTQTGPGLAVFRKQVRRGNLMALHQILGCVLEASDKLQSAQSLIEKEELAPCMEVIKSLKAELDSNGEDVSDSKTEDETASGIGFVALNADPKASARKELKRMKSLKFLWDGIEEVESQIAFVVKNGMIGSALCRILSVVNSLHYGTRATPDISAYTEIPINTDRGSYTRYINAVHLHFAGHYRHISNTQDLLSMLKKPVMDPNGIEMDSEARVNAMKAELSPILVSLHNTKNLGGTFKYYKADVLKVAKLLFKKIIPDAKSSEYGQEFENTEDEKEQYSKHTDTKSLAQIVREMGFEEFIRFSIATFVMTFHETRQALLIHNACVTILKESCNNDLQLVSKRILLGSDEDSSKPLVEPANDGKINADVVLFIDGAESLRAVQTSSKTRGETLDECKQRENDINELTRISNDSIDVVHALSEFGIARCTKLLSVRLDNFTENFSAEEFCKILRFFEAFFEYSAAIGSSGTSTLRKSISESAQSFMEHYSLKRIALITDYISKENWSPVTSVESSQQLVNKIVIIGKQFESRLGSNGDKNLPPVSWVTFNEDVSIPEPIKNRIVLHGETFVVVDSTTRFIEDFSFFMCCMVEFPSTIFPLTFNRFCDCMKEFNTKVCESVLGASAVDTAGLRSISAKHITIAAQTLYFVKTIVNEIRGVIKMQLPKRQILYISELERNISNLEKHREQLFKKLLSIMETFYVLHIDKLIAIDWDKMQISTDSQHRNSQDAKNASRSRADSIASVARLRSKLNSRPNVSSNRNDEDNDVSNCPSPVEMTPVETVKIKIPSGSQSDADSGTELEVTAIADKMVRQIRLFHLVLLDSIKQETATSLIETVAQNLSKALYVAISEKVSISEEIGRDNLMRNVKHISSVFSSAVKVKEVFGAVFELILTLPLSRAIRFPLSRASSTEITGAETSTSQGESVDSRTTAERSNSVTVKNDNPQSEATPTKDDAKDQMVESPSETDQTTVATVVPEKVNVDNTQVQGDSSVTSSDKSENSKYKPIEEHVADDTTQAIPKVEQQKVIVSDSSVKVAEADTKPKDKQQDFSERFRSKLRSNAIRSELRSESANSTSSNGGSGASNS